MVSFIENPTLIVEIYKFISPVFIWIEIMKNSFTNDGFKQTGFFQLLKQIRNEVSHFDVSQNERNESLFIKFVMIYKRLGLNLIETSFNIRSIWNELHNDYYKRNSINNLKSKLKSRELNNVEIYKDYLDSFRSILFSILSNTNEKNKIRNDLINIIFQYISPIIIWHEEMINANQTDSKLFKFVEEIKNRVCHLSDRTYENCTFLKEILKGILVVYKLFGVDLKYSDFTIDKIDFENISLCIEYKENEIRNEIIEDLKNQSYKKDYYVSLRELIDLLIVKVVPRVSFNVESILDVKEVRISNVKDVRQHTTIEINNVNDCHKTSNKKSNDDDCLWINICCFIIFMIILCGIIYGLYKLLQLLGLF